MVCLLGILLSLVLIFKTKKIYKERKEYFQKINNNDNN